MTVIGEWVGGDRGKRVGEWGMERCERVRGGEGREEGDRTVFQSAIVVNQALDTRQASSLADTTRFVVILYRTISVPYSHPQLP